MEDADLKLQKLKVDLRALLQSAGLPGLTLEEIERDYTDICHSPLPYEEFGATSPHELLANIPDVVFIAPASANGPAVYYSVSNAATRHLENLIERQRVHAPTRFGGTVPLANNNEQGSNIPNGPIQAAVSPSAPLHQAASVAPGYRTGPGFAEVARGAAAKAPETSSTETKSILRQKLSQRLQQAMANSGLYQQPPQSKISQVRQIPQAADAGANLPQCVGHQSNVQQLPIRQSNLQPAPTATLPEPSPLSLNAFRPVRPPNPIPLSAQQQAPNAVLENAPMKFGIRSVMNTQRQPTPVNFAQPAPMRPSVRPPIHSIRIQVPNDQQPPPNFWVGHRLPFQHKVQQSMPAIDQTAAAGATGADSGGLMTIKDAEQLKSLLRQSKGQITTASQVAQPLVPSQQNVFNQGPRQLVPSQQSAFGPPHLNTTSNVSRMAASAEGAMASANLPSPAAVYSPPPSPYEPSQAGVSRVRHDSGSSIATSVVTTMPEFPAEAPVIMQSQLPAGVKLPRALWETIYAILRDHGNGHEWLDIRQFQTEYARRLKKPLSAEFLMKNCCIKSYKQLFVVLPHVDTMHSPDEVMYIRLLSQSLKNTKKNVAMFDVKPRFNSVRPQTHGGMAIAGEGPQALDDEENLHIPKPLSFDIDTKKKDPSLRIPHDLRSQIYHLLWNSFRSGVDISTFSETFTKRYGASLNTTRDCGMPLSATLEYMADLVDLGKAEDGKLWLRPVDYQQVLDLYRFQKRAAKERQRQGFTSQKCEDSEDDEDFLYPK